MSKMWIIVKRLSAKEGRHLGEDGEGRRVCVRGGVLPHKTSHQFAVK